MRGSARRREAAWNSYRYRRGGLAALTTTGRSALEISNCDEVSAVAAFYGARAASRFRASSATVSFGKDSINFV